MSSLSGQTPRRLLHCARLPTARCAAALVTSSSIRSLPFISRRCYATSLPPPPSLRRGVTPHTKSGGAAWLPPPPPITAARLGPAAGAGTTHVPVTALCSPREVLAVFVPYVPTFFVGIPAVAALLPDEVRDQFIGRGRLLFFLKRFPFLFEMQVTQGIMAVVRLHPDVSHPERGSADAKFMMADVGETTSYVARPEFIVSAENLDGMQGSVLVRPRTAPPAVQVNMEERVPVVERLRALVPVDFVSVEELEERIPEDVIFHPYFNCQGGLLSIATKLPEVLQVVEGKIRRRPPHLAPLALDEFTLKDSPLPDVAALLQREVCAADIPHWVSITSLYEQLTHPQKHHIKQHYKSFAGFLRSHGRALAVSSDMLQVSKWICISPPSRRVEEKKKREDCAILSSAEKPALSARIATVAAGAAEGSHDKDVTSHTDPCSSTAASRPVSYTRQAILNALYDAFPPYKTLNLRDALQLLPVEMRASGLPSKVAPWLASHPEYFIVDFAESEDAAVVQVRRASERQPLDLALALYRVLPDRDVDVPADTVLARLEPTMSRVVLGIGVEQLGKVLPQWLQVTPRRGGHCGAVTATKADGNGEREQMVKCSPVNATEEEEVAARFTLRRLQELLVLEAAVERRQFTKLAKNSKTKSTADVAEEVEAEDLQLLPN